MPADPANHAPDHHPKPDPQRDAEPETDLAQVHAMKPCREFTLDPSLSETMRAGSILDVPGLRVGHTTHADARTGCSVLLCDRPAVAGVDIRGGGPATRELDLLDPSAMVDRIDAVLLTGGSVPGLAAADGVVRWLRDQGRGFPTPQGPIPIVPACAIFDLAQGDASAAPTSDDGLAAAAAATIAQPTRGSIGAGTGAAIGKARGHELASAGGVGSASWTSPDDVRMGAFVVLNALGDVVDPDTGRIISGARTEDDRPLHTQRWLIEHTAANPGPLPQFGRTNTTLAVVATNAPLTKADATRVAMMASTGMARAINPCHSPYDGDVVIALSTSPESAPPHNDPATILRLGTMAASVLAAAVLDAAWSASSRPELPNAHDLGWATP